MLGSLGPVNFKPNRPQAITQYALAAIKLEASQYEKHPCLVMLSYTFIHDPPALIPDFGIRHALGREKLPVIFCPSRWVASLPGAYTSPCRFRDSKRRALYVATHLACLICTSAMAGRLTRCPRKSWWRCWRDWPRFSSQQTSTLCCFYFDSF